MTARPRIDWKRLGDAALAASAQAYAPYSGFTVGAALLLSDGRIIDGCNVENASYGLALCAERNAIGTAVAQGQREIVAMAIATPSSPPGPPCGLCLQMMAEFCVDLELMLINPAGETQRTKLSKLLRQPFRWKGAGTQDWQPKPQQAMAKQTTARRSKSRPTRSR